MTASDGVQLHAEIVDCGAGDVTVIFCHGYMIDSRSWHFQRAALADQARLVLWDQRGHGRSGWATPANATIDQVGQDLFAVMQATAPHGPVVLVGHSMGGMAILGLAESHPELFGDRIVGATLIATSAGGLSGVTLGLPEPAARLLHQAVRTSLSLLRRQSHMVDTVRRVTSRTSFRLTQRYLFGSQVLQPVAELTARAMASTPIAVIAEFFPELDTFDKRTVVSALGKVPTLILVGDRDTITPISHSEALAREILGAELVAVAGAAHLLILESPQRVNEQLQRLVAGVAQHKTPPSPSEHASRATDAPT
ncbi:alpha/beta fold hydrolase [Saccharopolyspora phatthalungensis]|uniref:Pimeloyl-ACP methyl ester carboxylesterase n=1 Tax=Saccharopolyspora phatthalungensis TaxID=664693 RepID=A0A840Q5W8_9PSEU|nr:alpha/beta hydrolase [Saccharopolyspora phatthalungensis]MBB5156014.1 pimeloyl-ACP methyl ester carboxylesterase [Saccharopolyspora phatthalungensis]